MKIASWNVAGINACVKKGLLDFIDKTDFEVYCFQEVKASNVKIPEGLKNIEGYEFHNYEPMRKGYSGVAVLTKLKPLSVKFGLGDETVDEEARVVLLEFNKFFLINAYFPHANRKLTRLDFKLRFNELFLNFVRNLERKKPVVIAADFNVAHKEIDLRNPKQNMKNAGFTSEEKDWFDKFVGEGFVDTFREFNKECGNYTWWTYRNNARERNIGWRIDYFVVSNSLKGRLSDSKILKDICGSDHCPILLDINL